MSTHGRRLFSRGGEEYLKICSTPQKGSRGGDTFSSSRGGVEGGKGEGQTKFLQEKSGIFAKAGERKHKVFSTLQRFRGQLLIFNFKNSKNKDFIKEVALPTSLGPEFFEGP